MDCDNTQVSLLPKNVATFEPDGHFDIILPGLVSECAQGFARWWIVFENVNPAFSVFWPKQTRMPLVINTAAVAAGLAGRKTR